MSEQEYSQLVGVQLAVTYRESQAWLWYEDPAPDEAPLFHDRTRVCFGPGDEDPVEAQGSSVLLLPARGVGVATVWVEGTCDDPWARKHQLWRNEDGYLWKLFDATGLPGIIPLAAERHYPFISVQVEADDLDAFSTEHVSQVGSWLTGGYEQDSAERLRTALAANLSGRHYERLFMRWTDALALYNASTLSDECQRKRLLAGERPADSTYEHTKLRAAQLFEYCILARRIFRSDAREISRLSTSVNMRAAPVVSMSWRTANAVLTRFSEAELEIITAPLASSVEAEELVDAAVRQFGVTALVEDTQRAYELLDRRLQWVRGQWLAVIAVIAFAINAAIALFR